MANVDDWIERNLDPMKNLAHLFIINYTLCIRWSISEARPQLFLACLIIHLKQSEKISIQNYLDKKETKI